MRVRGTKTLHMSGGTNGITEGVIWKQILIFFFPILVGTFFQQLYNTVDAVVVGQFVGKEALSSVGGSSGQIINFVVGFLRGCPPERRLSSLRALVQRIRKSWIGLCIQLMRLRCRSA